MANIPGRQRNIPYDYSTYNTDIPLDGEREYFNSVFAGQQNHALSVLGDGTNQANALPFVEPIIIHATANMSLNDLRISGNRVLVWNTTAGTITVNIGTTGVPDNINLPAYQLLYVYFDGTNWRNAGGDHIHNNEFLGNPYMLAEGDRANAYILNNGSAVSPNWTDVDFSAYVPTGQYLKGLILFGRLTFTGNGALNNVQAFIRQNGSGVTDAFQTRIFDIGYSGLGAGVSLKCSSVFSVLCDSSGIIEYIVSNAQAALSLLILGYYLESRL